MAYYRLYFLSDGHFARVEEFEASDDPAAEDVATRLAAGAAVELWCGSRKVSVSSASRTG